MENKAFTLIELLVVILIIGILAAIAYPQYKLSLLRSEYSKLKGYVETMHDSVQRYYLANGTWPKKLTDLDIELAGELFSDDAYIRIKNPSGTICWLWNTGYAGYVACDFTRFNYKVRYEHVFLGSTTDKYCYTETSDTDTIVAKLCQLETGKTSTNKLYTY